MPMFLGWFDLVLLFWGLDGGFDVGVGKVGRGRGVGFCSCEEGRGR